MNNDNQPRKIGLDPGFSTIKLAEIQNGGVQTYVMPSTVGLGAATESGVGLAGVVRAHGRGQRPHHVIVEGEEYLVGPGVSDYTRPIHRMDFDRFTDSPELRASLYAALARVLDNGSCQLALAIGLPVEVLQDRNKAQRVERCMRDWLVGDHAFQLDGQPMRFTVTSIRAKIAQPVASWFDWGMDQTGQWCKGAEALKAPTLIIDEGFNTLDLLVAQNGQISQRHTGGDTLGMRRAAERLAQLVERRYGVQLDLVRADGLNRRVVLNRKALIYVAGEPVDVSAEARQVVRSLETDVMSFIERVVGNAAEHRVILTGGGALALSRRLLSVYRHATVMHEPILANARGLAKLAVRPDFLS